MYVELDLTVIHKVSKKSYKFKRVLYTSSSDLKFIKIGGFIEIDGLAYMIRSILSRIGSTGYHKLILIKTITDETEKQVLDALRKNWVEKEV